jgi:hypothetical protein
MLQGAEISTEKSHADGSSLDLSLSEGAFAAFHLQIETPTLANTVAVSAPAS